MNIFKNDWHETLLPIIETEYFTELLKKLETEYRTHRCYPPSDEVFRAFYLTPFKDVKLVFLGQDPYHTPGMANGLSFSVNEGMKVPPSLMNIFKEMDDEFGHHPATTDFSKVARSGVLFLNTALSVREGVPMSHDFLNWNRFTDFVIEKLGEREDVVFLLLGRKAMDKAPLIKHKENIVSAAHPSPFSAYKGFFGSNVFINVNDRLQKIGRTPVDWS